MKKITTSSLVGISALVLAASNLPAQVCNGTAPFSIGHMRAGVGLTFPSNATSLDGEFAYGSASGLYGGATVNIIDSEASTESATVFGLNGGKAMPVGTKKTVQMCPQVFVNFGSYPADRSTMSLGGGASFGTTLKQTSFDLVPFGSALLHRDSFDQTIGTTKVEGSDTNLDVVLGAGFVFSKKWTVRPFLIVPLTNDRKSAFGVMGSINFGK